MIEIDARDIVVIDADASTVHAAVVDEFSGRTHWWLPHLSVTPRNDIPADQAGAIFDVAVRGSPPSRFTGRIVESSENEIRMEYIGGDFRGEGIWTFQAQDGKTGIAVRWHVTPVGWMGFLLSLDPRAAREAAPYHKVMSAGFDGLKRHVGKRETVPA